MKVFPLLNRKGFGDQICLPCRTGLFVYTNFDTEMKRLSTHVMHKAWMEMGRENGAPRNLLA